MSPAARRMRGQHDPDRGELVDVAERRRPASLPPARPRPATSWAGGSPASHRIRSTSASSRFSHACPSGPHVPARSWWRSSTTSAVRVELLGARRGRRCGRRPDRVGRAVGESADRRGRQPDPRGEPRLPEPAQDRDRVVVGRAARRRDHRVGTRRPSPSRWSGSRSDPPWPRAVRIAGKPVADVAATRLLELEPEQVEQRLLDLRRRPGRRGEVECGVPLRRVTTYWKTRCQRDSKAYGA